MRGIQHSFRLSPLSSSNGLILIKLSDINNTSQFLCEKYQETGGQSIPQYYNERNGENHTNKAFCYGMFSF